MKMEGRDARALFHCLCFYLLMFMLPHLIAADEVSDTILVGEPLTGTKTRISTKGMFQLGFFNLQGTNKWYVGVWYAHASEQTIAWMANSEHPLHNASGVFNLTEDGSLVLSYGGTVIWSTIATKKASTAVIRDTGNLIVTSAENSSEITWQSFDNPGNTWLPDMKISVRQRLTSWKSPSDPSPGVFTLQMDPTGVNQYVLMWNNSIRYWESGVWNGQGFSKVPEMMRNFQFFDFSFHDNSTYKYFTYSYMANSAPKFLARFVLATSGSIQMHFLLDTTKNWSMFWSKPSDSCEVYAVCGAYGACNQNNVQTCNCVHGFVPADKRAWESGGWSAGCMRKTPLECHAANQTADVDGFLALTVRSVPPGAITSREHSSSMEVCKEACLGNCSCVAYAYPTNGIAPTCELWFGELINVYVDASSSMSLFVRLAASDVPNSSSKKKKATVVGVGVGSVGGLCAILALLLMFLLWRRRRRSSLMSTEYGPSSLTIFSYRELQTATKNFSERLGGGGFGSVFKGTLPDKSLVAVKKLESVTAGQGEKQFRMEVTTIGTIQHLNLIRLRGFCSEGFNRLLVYEYMPNGSLNNFLLSRTKTGIEESKALDWKTRFGIALGTARGILYLHENCRDCILHCDIKPENILLDSDFSAKVADFGLAKMIGRDFSRVLTTIRGTRGYLAPEWISGMPITTKADVFSFGMTLLEIIAGRRNVHGETDPSDFFFPAWAAAQINKGDAMALLGQELESSEEAEQVRRAAMVAVWCIQDEEELRPSMREVVQILQGIKDVAAPPIPRTLQPIVEKVSGLVFYFDKEADHSSPSNPT